MAEPRPLPEGLGERLAVVRTAHHFADSKTTAVERVKKGEPRDQVLAELNDQMAVLARMISDQINGTSATEIFPGTLKVDQELINQ